MDNSGKETEHPKPQLELIENTLSSIQIYATAQGLTFLESALVLNLNEQRCIHFHIDQIVGMMAEDRKDKQETKQSEE